MLTTSPLRHLEEACHCKQEGRHTLCHEAEGQPRSHLVSVVGTANKAEETCHGVGSWHGNLALFSACRSEVSESCVDGEVAILTHQEQSQTSIQLSSTKAWGGVEWVVDEVGHEGSKSPVVATIFE